MKNMSDYKFRAGDTVFHKPSGEQWVLSVGELEGSVMPAGWPRTTAHASDCELINPATDAEQIHMLEMCSKIQGDDPRKTKAMAELSSLLTDNMQ